jgi:hypothetical protein
MNSLSFAQIASFARALLAMLGGSVATSGYMSADMYTMLTGAGLFAATVGWSLYKNYKASTADGQGNALDFASYAVQEALKQLKAQADKAAASDSKAKAALSAVAVTAAVVAATAPAPVDSGLADLTAAQPTNGEG